MLISGIQIFLMSGFRFIQVESPYKQCKLEMDMLFQRLCWLQTHGLNSYILQLTQSSSWWGLSEQVPPEELSFQLTFRIDQSLKMTDSLSCLKVPLRMVCATCTLINIYLVSQIPRGKQLFHKELAVGSQPPGLLRVPSRLNVGWHQ